MKLRAVIYGRISTRGQEDGSSLETQEERSRKYCQEQGYIVLSVHLDIHTGAEMDRPKLNEALSIIKRGEADVLVAYDLDRLSRNQTHLAVILYKIIEECGARAEFVTCQLDDSITGKVMRNTLSIVAEIEREKIKERTQRGLRARATKGNILPGPHPIYGYLWSDGRRSFVIDPVTAPIVQRIFNEAVQGRTLYGIASGLDADGIPTATQYFHSLGMKTRQASGGWKVPVVAQILHNPTYTGNHAAYRWAGGKVWKEGKKEGQPRRRVKTRMMRSIDNEEDAQIIVPITCPAIIDQATYEQAQQQLAENKASAARNTKGPQPLLARGFVICGYCGKPMAVVSGSSSKGRWYRCMHKPYSSSHYKDLCMEGGMVRAKRIDEDVWAKVSELLKHPAILHRALDMRQEESQSVQERIQGQVDTFNKLIDKAKTKRAKLIDKFGDEDDDDIAAKIKQLGQEIQRLNLEKEKVASLLPSSDHIEGLREIVDDLNKVFERMPGMPEMGKLILEFSKIDFNSYEFKRKVLSLLGVKVRVWRGDDGKGAKWKVEFGFDSGIDSLTSAG